MLGPERLFAYRQCALVERPRPCKVALIMKQSGEIVEGQFFFNDTATTEIYALSLHDALPISRPREVALVMEQVAEIVEGQRRSGMLEPVLLFICRQHALTPLTQPRRVAFFI